LLSQYQAQMNKVSPIDATSKAQSKAKSPSKKSPTPKNPQKKKAVTQV